MTSARIIAPGLYIFGFGGHARAVADVAIAMGYPRLVFVDPAAHAGDNFAGFPAVTVLDNPDPDWPAIVAIGDTATRRRVAGTLEMRSTAIIGPSATVGLSSVIEAGAFIGQHAHIGASSRIGKGSIINTGAIVDHDCSVGDYAHISVAATVAGSCRIGANSMIGAGATVIDRVSIGEDVIVGAGATVVNDLSDPGTYVGTPARRLERT